MSREELILESWRFTNSRACAREIKNLLENSDYKIIVQVRPKHAQSLSNELEYELDGRSDQYRVKVERVGMEKMA